MFYMLNNQKQLIIISFFFRPNQALKGAGLTLELTLAEPANVFTCCLATDGKHWAGGGGAGFTSGGGVDGLGSTATNGMAAGANYVTPGVDAASFSYAIQNVEYIASTIEFDEAFTATFMSMIQANGLIQFHGVTFKNYIWTWNYSDGSTEVIPVAIRARSLKGILTTMRVQKNLNNVIGFSLSRRVSAGLSQYVWNIGSIRLPQAPVRLIQNSAAEGYTQAYCEIVKLFSSFNSLDYAGRVEYKQYFDSGFAIGISTEAYSQDTSLLESGMDTASQSLPVRLELLFQQGAFVRQAAATINGVNIGDLQAQPKGEVLRADTFSMLDVIYSVTADGLMTSSE